MYPKPQPRRHCVRWGPSSPEFGTGPQFLAMSVEAKVPNAWVDQNATWYRGPRPRRHCVIIDGDPAPLKRGTAPPLFGPCLCGQTARRDQDHATWYGGRPLPGTQLPRSSACMQPPALFGRCLLWPNGRPSQLLLSSCLEIKRCRYNMSLRPHVLSSFSQNLFAACKRCGHTI